jgi:plastocyanin
MRSWLALALVAPPLLVRGPTTHPVDQRQKQFNPAEIRISVGDSVRFKNNDDVMHNVFSSTPGSTFNLRRQAKGTSLAVAFPQRGTAVVRCAFHPEMRLTVVVK